jgi:hypothetical protein
MDKKNLNFFFLLSCVWSVEVGLWKCARVQVSAIERKCAMRLSAGVGWIERRCDRLMPVCLSVLKRKCGAIDLIGRE